MTVETCLSEKWTCDNCGKVVEKTNRDKLQRVWPPGGWMMVDIQINERLRSTGRHACGEGCARVLAERVIAQLWEAQGTLTR